MNPDIPIPRRSLYLFKASVASLLCAALVLDPVVFAAPAVFPEKNSLEAVKISKHLGRVEESFQGRNGKTVIYLQDAHDSLEAQENIAEMIHALVKDSGVKTVYEEGYEGPVPTDSYFGFIEDVKLRKKTSYFFLDKLRIGGAEYAHINRKNDFRLIGADNIKLHLENIAKYQEAAKFQKATREDLDALSQKIRLLVDSNFSKEAKEWMRSRERFESGGLSLLDYLKRSQEGTQERRSAGAQGAFPSIELLMRAEASKDPAAREQIKRIEAGELFREIDLMEASIADRFFRKDRDKRIFQHYKELHLLKRLNEIQVTPAEYENAKTTLAALNTRGLADFIARETKAPVLLSREWEKNIQNAIRFYEIAHARDEAMGETMSEFMENPAEQTSVLVFGGFHKEKIRAFLQASGCSYQIVTPNLSGPDKIHQGYYKQLMSVGQHSFEIPAALARAARAATLFVMPAGRRQLLAVYRSALAAANLPDPLFVRQVEKELSAISSQPSAKSVQAGISAESRKLTADSRKVRSELRRPSEREDRSAVLREQEQGEFRKTVTLDVNERSKGEPILLKMVSLLKGTYVMPLPEREESDRQLVKNNMAFALKELKLDRPVKIEITYIAGVDELQKFFSENAAVDFVAASSAIVKMDEFQRYLSRQSVPPVNIGTMSLFKVGRAVKFLRARSDLRTLDRLKQRLQMLTVKDSHAARVLSERLELTDLRDVDALRYLGEDIEWFRRHTGSYYTPKENPTVSIVILHYGTTGAKTLQVLKNLSHTTYQNFNILLVDNNSPDQFSENFTENLDLLARGMPADRFARLKKRIHLVTNKSNLGYTGGNNQAARLALQKGSDYVLFMNNDSLLERDGLEKMVQAVKGRPEIGALQPSLFYQNTPEKEDAVSEDGVLSPEARKAAEAWTLNDFIPGEMKKGNAELVPGSGNLFYKEPTMLGTAQFVRSDMIRLSGGFDTRYFMFGDEDNVGYRYWMTGLKKAMISDVFLSHGLFESFGQFRAQYFIWRNHMFTAEKYYQKGTVGRKIAESVSPYSFFNPNPSKNKEELDKRFSGEGKNGDLMFMAAFKGIYDGLMGYFSPTDEDAPFGEADQIKKYADEFSGMRSALEILLRLIKQENPYQSRLMIYGLHEAKDRITLDKEIPPELRNRLKDALWRYVEQWKNWVRTEQGDIYQTRRGFKEEIFSILENGTYQELRSEGGRSELRSDFEEITAEKPFEISVNELSGKKIELVLGATEVPKEEKLRGYYAEFAIVRKGWLSPQWFLSLPNDKRFQIPLGKLIGALRVEIGRGDEEGVTSKFIGGKAVFQLTLPKELLYSSVSRRNAYVEVVPGENSLKIGLLASEEGKLPKYKVMVRVSRSELRTRDINRADAEAIQEMLQQILEEAPEKKIMRVTEAIVQNRPSGGYQSASDFETRLRGKVSEIKKSEWHLIAVQLDYHSALWVSSWKALTFGALFLAAVVTTGFWYIGNSKAPVEIPESAHAPDSYKEGEAHIVFSPHSSKADFEAIKPELDQWVKESKPDSSRRNAPSLLVITEGGFPLEALLPILPQRIQQQYQLEGPRSVFQEENEGALRVAFNKYQTGIKKHTEAMDAWTKQERIGYAASMAVTNNEFSAAFAVWRADRQVRERLEMMPFEAWYRYTKENSTNDYYERFYRNDLNGFYSKLKTLQQAQLLSTQERDRALRGLVKEYSTQFSGGNVIYVVGGAHIVNKDLLLEGLDGSYSNRLGFGEDNLGLGYAGLYRKKIQDGMKLSETDEKNLLAQAGLEAMMRPLKPSDWTYRQHFEFLEKIFQIAETKGLSPSQAMTQVSAELKKQNASYDYGRSILEIMRRFEWVTEDAYRQFSIRSELRSKKDEPGLTKTKDERIAEMRQELKSVLSVSVEMVMAYEAKKLKAGELTAGNVLDKDTILRVLKEEGYKKVRDKDEYQRQSRSELRKNEEPAHAIRPEDDAVWDSIMRRINFIQANMVYLASKQKREVKVGGHQSAAASMKEILMAAWVAMHDHDYAAAKPHSQPADIAIQYLLGKLHPDTDVARQILKQFRNATIPNLNDEILTEISKLNPAAGVIVSELIKPFLSKLDIPQEPVPGIPAYPRPDGPGRETVPMGSVGLGASTTVALAILHKYLLKHGADVPEDSHFWALIGDGETDEGNALEMLNAAIEYEAHNVTHVIDYNRQSLDGNRGMFHYEELKHRYGRWETIELKWGRKIEAAFAKENGEFFKTAMEQLTNAEYQALLALGVKSPENFSLELKESLLSKISASKEKLTSLLNTYSGTELYSLFTDLGGHDLVKLSEAMRQARANKDKPVAIIAWTIKGHGLPAMMGNPMNHSQLLTAKQMEELRVASGIPAGEDFPVFDPASEEGKMLAKIRRQIDRQEKTNAARIERNRAQAASRLPQEFPKRFPLAPAAGYFPTQLALNEIIGKLHQIAETDIESIEPELRAWKSFADALAVISPDVISSTLPSAAKSIFGKPLSDSEHQFLQSLHQKYGLVLDRGVEQSWNGRNIEAGLAEMKAVNLAIAFAMSPLFFGASVFPVMSAYDMFIFRRALDIWFFGQYWGSPIVAIGTPSGSGLAPEGGLHQSIMSLIIALMMPNTIAYEPAFIDELEYIFPEMMRRMMMGDTQDRAISYLRGSTVPVRRSILWERLKRQKDYAGIPDMDAARDLWGEQVTRGGYALINFRGYSREDRLAYMKEVLKTDDDASLHLLELDDYNPLLNVVHILASGPSVNEAVAASDQLLKAGIFANVIVVTSPSLLAGRLGKNIQNPDYLLYLDPRDETNYPHLRRLIPLEERAFAPMVGVADGSSLHHALAASRLGMASGSVDLGIEKNGRSVRSVEEIWAYHGIASQNIVTQAVTMLENRDIAKGTAGQILPIRSELRMDTTMIAIVAAAAAAGYAVYYVRSVYKRLMIPGYQDHETIAKALLKEFREEAAEKTKRQQILNTAQRISQKYRKELKAAASEEMVFDFAQVSALLGGRADEVFKRRQANPQNPLTADFDRRLARAQDKALKAIRVDFEERLKAWPKDVPRPWFWPKEKSKEKTRKKSSETKRGPQTRQPQIKIETQEVPPVPQIETAPVAAEISEAERQKNFSQAATELENSYFDGGELAGQAARYIQIAPERNAKQIKGFETDFGNRVDHAIRSLSERYQLTAEQQKNLAPYRAAFVEDLRTKITELKRAQAEARKIEKETREAAEAAQKVINDARQNIAGLIKNLMDTVNSKLPNMVPGESIEDEKGIEKRIQVLADVISQAPIPDEEREGNFVLITKFLDKAQERLDAKRSELRSGFDPEKVQKEVGAFLEKIPALRLERLLRVVAEFPELEKKFRRYEYLKNYEVSSDESWSAERKLSFQIPEIIALKQVLEGVQFMRVDEDRHFSRLNMIRRIIRQMEDLGFRSPSSPQGGSRKELMAKLGDIFDLFRAEALMTLGDINEFIEEHKRWFDARAGMNRLPREFPGELESLIPAPAAANPLIVKIFQGVQADAGLRLQLNPHLNGLIYLTERLEEIRENYAEETRAIDEIKSLGRFRSYFESTKNSGTLTDLTPPGLEALRQFASGTPDPHRLPGALRPLHDFYFMAIARMTAENFPAYTGFLDFDEFLRLQGAEDQARNTKIFALRAYALFRAIEFLSRSELRLNADALRQEKPFGAGRSELRANSPEKITDARSVEFYKINRRLIRLFAAYKNAKDKKNQPGMDSILKAVHDSSDYLGLFLPEIQSRNASESQTLGTLEQKTQAELKDLAVSLGKQIKTYDKKFIAAYASNNPSLLETYNREVVRLAKERLKVQILRLQYELKQPGVISRQSPVLTIVLSVVDIYRRISYEHFWRRLRAQGEERISRFRMVDAAGSLVFNLYYEREPVVRVERAVGGELKLHQIVWKNVEVPGGPDAVQPVLTPMNFQDLDSALRSRIHALASQEQDFTQLIYHDLALQDISRTLKTYEADPSQISQLMKEQVLTSLESVLEGPNGKNGLRKKIAQVRDPKKSGKMLPMPGDNLETAQTLITAGNLKEALQLVESAGAWISARLTDIERKKNATVRKRDYAHLLIRHQELEAGLKPLASRLAAQPLRNDALRKSLRRLEEIRQTHFGFIARESTYRDFQYDLQGIVAALRTLINAVPRALIKDINTGNIAGREGLALKVKSVLEKLDQMKREGMPAQRDFDFGNDQPGTRSELRLARTDVVFTDKRTLIDFNDLAANFSDTQIEEILFVAQKAGKNSAVHIYNVDPTHELGKFLLSLKIKELEVTSETLDQLTVSGLRGFSGEVAHLSSRNSGMSAEKLKQILGGAGIHASSVYSLAYQDKQSGTLGVGLKDLEEGKLKNQLPDYMALDAQGRIYLADPSVAGAWQALYQASLVFSRAA